MKISKIDLSGNDERGYTAEYEHGCSGKQLIIFRKAGTVSGRHYHKGLSKTKDPEIFVLLHGKCTVNWRLTEENEMQTAELEGPVQIEIPVNTWHELVMHTDCVCLEMNSIEEHRNDTFR